MPRLTADQRFAATTPEECVYVEAAPGCGKTTVAAERFGYLLYGPSPSDRGIRALSFTRSATRELRRRISGRWGTAAVSWPNQVSTLDNLYCELTTYLLRTRALTWFGERIDIEVLDTWSGQRNARLIQAGRHRRIIHLRGTTVCTTSEQLLIARLGLSRKAHLEDHLTAGLCTHEEIRTLMRLVLLNGTLRPAIAAFLQATMSALIVDELFDANPLDLDFVRLCIVSGIPVSLIGDPWQALYEFRDATPDLVPELLGEHGFTYFMVDQSFRFESDEMVDLASTLRLRHPVPPLPPAPPDADVVLATTWGTLWAQDPSVLPLSFGTVDNLTDAALSIVLDHLVTARFKERAAFANDARAVLSLPTERTPEENTLIQGVLQHLRTHGPTDAASALRRVRETTRLLGGRRATPLRDRNERRALRNVQRLAERAANTGRSVPGLTVHQAKGREWKRVAVALQPSEVGRLAVGLDPDSEDDRKVYVALTRARLATGLL